MLCRGLILMLLAKAKKRAERKSQQRTSPKATKNKSPKSKLMEHGEADNGTVHATQPSTEWEKCSTTASSADVTSTSVECHGFLFHWSVHLILHHTLPYSPSMFKFVKPSSMTLTRRRVDLPPNL
ncbi:hypothetical protein OSTOST_20926, partial [Ostertagia ostertagi]